MSCKLGHEIKKLVGKNYGKATQTVEKFVGNLERIGQFMETQGLQSIRHMKTKHVEKFVADMKARGLSASTMANYMTAARAIAHAIGKDNIVPRANAELGISRADRYQPKVADRGKMAKVRDALYAKNEWQGLSCEMAAAFGLRLKETLVSHETVVREGTTFLVVAGAKGGRPREVPVENQAQRDALSKVEGYLARTGCSTLIPPDKTLKQAQKKQSNDLHRLGATKANHSNVHLARHSYAQDRQSEGKSDEENAKLIGHGRKGSTRHYTHPKA